MKKSVRIELEPDVKEGLRKQGKDYDPPLKLKTYIEYMLKKLFNGDVTILKR